MHRVNTILPLIILLVMMAGFASPRKACPQTIEVVTEELPPFQTLKDGQIGGFATEIVQACFEQAGVSYTIAAYPWARAYNIALTKGNICIYSIVRTPEREDRFKWSSVIARIHVRMYAYRKDGLLPPKSLEEARGHLVAAVRDDVTHQYLLEKEFMPGKNIFVVNSSREAFRAISSFNDISLAILDDVTLPYRALDSGISPDDLIPAFDIPDLSLAQWIAFSKDTPDDIVTRFTDAFNRLEKDGTIAKIKKAWNIRE